MGGRERGVGNGRRVGMGMGRCEARRDPAVQGRAASTGRMSWRLLLGWGGHEQPRSAASVGAPPRVAPGVMGEGDAGGVHACAVPHRWVGRGVVCPLEWRRRGRVLPPGAGLLRGDRLPPSWSRPINFFLLSPVGVVAHRPPAPRSSPVQVLPSQLRVATRSFVFFCRRGVWPPIAPAAGGGPTLPGVCRRTWRAPVVARAAQSPGRAGRRRRKGGGGVGGWGGLNSGRPSPAGRAICPPPKCPPKGPTPRRRQASHGPLS